MTVDSGSRGEIEDRRPGLDRRRRPHRARAGALADQARRRRADHRQDRRAGDHLPGPGRPGSHAGVLPPAGDGRRRSSRAASRFAGVNFWVEGAKAARLPLERIGEGLTPFPFALIFPQDAHERVLIERLDALGVKVERRTELVRFDQQRRRRASGAQAGRRLGGDLRGGLSRRLRRCAFDREGGAGDRLSRRDLFRTFSTSPTSKATGPATERRNPRRSRPRPTFWLSFP